VSTQIHGHTHTHARAHSETNSNTRMMGKTDTLKKDRHICVCVRARVCVYVCVCVGAMITRKYTKRRIAHARGVGVRSVTSTEGWNLGVATKRGGGLKCLVNLKAHPTTGRAGVCVCVCVCVCFAGCMWRADSTTQQWLLFWTFDRQTNFYYIDRHIWCVCVFVCVCVGVNTERTLNRYVQERVKPGSLLATDCGTGMHTHVFNQLGYMRVANNHALHQFNVPGLQMLDGTTVSSNPIESQWAAEQQLLQKFNAKNIHTQADLRKYNEIYMFRRNFSCNSAADRQQILPFCMLTRAIAEIMQDRNPGGWGMAETGIVGGGHAVRWVCVYVCCVCVCVWYVYGLGCFGYIRYTAHTHTHTHTHTQVAGGCGVGVGGG
jgi:hypothetical protein